MKMTSWVMAAGVAAFGAVFVNADVIVQDGFDTNITDDGGDPVDAGWSVFGTPAVASHALDGANGVLDLSGADGFDGVLAGFSSVTLGSVGDSISFSARVRHDVAGAISNGFRIALINTAGTNPDASTNDTFGFTLLMNLGNTSAGGFAEATNTTLGTGALPAGNPNLDLTGGNVWHTVNGTIKYLGGNDFELTAGVDGSNKINAVVYTDVNPTFTYDRIVFGLGGSGPASGFQLDDVSVTATIPEPATASACLLMGVGGLLVRRLR